MPPVPPGSYAHAYGKGRNIKVIIETSGRPKFVKPAFYRARLNKVSVLVNDFPSIPCFKYLLNVNQDIDIY